MESHSADLSFLPRDGATFVGIAVAAVALELDDGRKLALELLPGTAPIPLDRVHLTGAAVASVPVARIELALSDGRKQSMDLPVPRAMAKMTPRQKKILATVHASPTPIAAKVIATRMGLKNQRGSFYADLKNVIARGLIDHDEETGLYVAITAEPTTPTPEGV